MQLEVGAQRGALAELLAHLLDGTDALHVADHALGDRGEGPFGVALHANASREAVTSAS